MCVYYIIIIDIVKTATNEVESVVSDVAFFLTAAEDASSVSVANEEGQACAQL